MTQEAPQENIYLFLEKKLTGVQIFRRDLMGQGTGAFGKVFLGKEKGAFPRYLAVKLVRPQNNAHLLQVEVNSLHYYREHVKGHTHLISIHDIVGGDQNDDFLIYTMDLADNASNGEPVHSDEDINGYQTYSLHEYMAGRPFSLEEIHQLVTGLLDGLAELEKLGLVHRDLKPNNIFFVNKNIVLGDVGTIVQAGTFVECLGTAVFMAPEKVGSLNQLTQFWCHDDLYQLGAVIYLLSLKPDDRAAFLERQLSHIRQYGRLPHRAPVLSYEGGLTKGEASRLNQFLNLGWRGRNPFAPSHCACANQPGNRFQSVEEFRTAWEEMMQAAREPMRHLKRRLAAVGIALLFLVAMLFYGDLRGLMTRRQQSNKEMAKYLLQNHQAILDYEGGWERVLFKRGNPNYDPLGARLDSNWKIVTPGGGRSAEMSEKAADGHLRSLELFWKGQRLEPDFEVRFILEALPRRCELLLQLESERPNVAPLTLKRWVTHAGIFRTEDEIIEEGSRAEWTIPLVVSEGKWILATAENVNLEPEGDFPAAAGPWHLRIRVSTEGTEPVSLKFLQLFRFTGPHPAEENFKISL